MKAGGRLRQKGVRLLTCLRLLCDAVGGLPCPWIRGDKKWGGGINYAKIAILKAFFIAM